MANFASRYYPNYPGPPQPPGPSYAPYRSQYPAIPMDSGYPPMRPVFTQAYPPFETTQGTSNVNQATMDPSTGYPRTAGPAPATGPKTADKKDQVISKRYKYYGYALIFLAVAIFGLEIANVVFTYTTFGISGTTYVKKAFATPYILTWVAPGIWGSIFVFITGQLAIRVAGKYNRLVRIFALFCSLSSTVFTPAIVAISVAELVMYPNFPSGDSQPMFNNLICYNFGNSATLSCPKFVLPLVIAILGGLAFYLTLMVTFIFCCCWKQQESAPRETDITEEIDEFYPQARNPPYYPPNNQLMRFPQSQPYPMYRPAPKMVEPDMDFLRSYPMYRPAASRGFGYAPAFNRQSFGNYEPSPAYRVVYG